MNTTTRTAEPAEPTGGHPFWPTHVLDQVILLYVVSGVLLALAILLPFGLHGEADPLHKLATVKPAWYFLAVYQLLKYVPPVLGAALVGTFFVVMLGWPLFCSAIERRQPGAAWPKLVGVAVMALFILLTALGRVSDTTLRLGGRTVSFDTHGLPHFGAGEEAAR